MKPAIGFNSRNLFKRDKGICQLCKKRVHKTTHQGISDYLNMHIIPVSEGGKTEWSNMCIAHTKCVHEERVMKKFRMKHEAKLKRLHETERLLKKDW